MQGERLVVLLEAKPRTGSRDVEVEATNQVRVVASALYIIWSEKSGRKMRSSGFLGKGRGPFRLLYS